MLLCFVCFLVYGLCCGCVVSVVLVFVVVFSWVGWGLVYWCLGVGGLCLFVVVCVVGVCVGW
jgi:hypothetical protein